MTLLSSISSVCRRVGIGAPISVVNATDDLTLQMLDLAQESAEEISKRHGWRAMRVLYTFPTVAAQAQPNALPADYDRLAPGLTFWNLTQRQPVSGPLSAADWARMVALASFAQPNLVYRFAGSSILLYPTPAAGQVLSLEYVSNRPIVAADGVTFKSTFSADDDTTRFPEHLFLKDLRWRWKAAKGLNYSEEKDAYERAYELEAAADRGEIEVHTSASLSGAFDNGFAGQVGSVGFDASNTFGFTADAL